MKGLKMHLYFWDKKRLKRILRKFRGGQFLMETKDGLVYRGEVRDYSVSDNKARRFLIYFNWLRERRMVKDEYGKSMPKWFLVETPLGLSYLDVGYTTYYPQPDEGRLKLWGEFKEVCHFFRKGDYTNLVEHEDEFAPYGQLHQEQLWQVILFSLWRKKLPKLSQLVLSAFLYKKQQQSQ